MKRRVGRWGLVALGAVVVAMVVVVPVSAGVPGFAAAGAGSGVPRADPPPSSLTRAQRATVTADLTDLARSDAQGQRSAALSAATDAPGMPTCTPPPVPAATYPPGNSYGVPFLAAITNGQVLAGYDEWTANHLVWKVKGTTYDLYPWQSKIYDITGWVSGLLQLPSLTADIAPQDVVFCDQGGSNCLSADWPAGQCIHILSQYGPSPASPTPPPAIGNGHPEGTSCYGYSTPTFGCFPFVVSLTPSGDTHLSVTGVEPDGALDIQVTTSAVTTASEIPPPPSTTSSTCQDDPTTVTLSTVATLGLPPTAPGPPNPPNTDDRTLQTQPQPLTGPLDSGTSTVAGNDFEIPAFVPSPSGSPCSVTLATLLNTYAGGWNGVFKDQDEGLYYVDGGTDPIVAAQGWAQFSATTTVVSFGGPTLPVGPPSNFNWQG